MQQFTLLLRFEVDEAVYTTQCKRRDYEEQSATLTQTLVSKLCPQISKDSETMLHFLVESSFIVKSCRFSVGSVRFTS
jgi:hypothetical protein